MCYYCFCAVKDTNHSLKSPSLVPSSATPAASPAPTPPAAAAKAPPPLVLQPAVETVKQSTVKTPPAKLDDMELDLDLEIENMKLDDNIDPSVRQKIQLASWAYLGGNLMGSNPPNNVCFTIIKA